MFNTYPENWPDQADLFDDYLAGLEAALDEVGGIARSGDDKSVTRMREPEKCSGCLDVKNAKPLFINGK
ncbi:hypothetical protein [Aquibium microcysteis]|uniref:hypothetical protein n=1 Tax=Aquibium microcysteis TaxID=675281 RepID=UPI00165D05E2|nr:hypothetical protein [Aquibium microcysteis]